MLCQSLIGLLHLGQRESGLRRLNGCFFFVCQLDAQMFFRKLCPFTLHHYRRAINDDVQKAANQ